MASTNRPLDESTATLVSPDEHLHAKDLLSTPTNASTDMSSGTVSDEEPSTPEPLADVPVSVLCGWAHADGPNGKVGLEATKESEWPHLDDAKDLAAENPKGWPPTGTPDKGSDLVPIPEPGDSSKPDPAKLHTLKGTGKAGTDATSEDDSVSVQCGWPDGNASKPDPAKLQPDNDNDNDETRPETAGPERRTPGTVGPEGQPPWGVKNLAATAATATSLAGPEGQPPWGIKNLGAAALNATAVAGPEGQPPWGVKNLVASTTTGGGPEGQPPWGTKGFAATTRGNESANNKGDDGAQDASA